MKYKFIVAFCFLLAAGAQAQQTFISQGKIEFERKTNMHRLYFSGESDAWSESFKKLIPQFKTNYFDLLFTANKSLYQPGKEGEVQKSGFFESPATENVVYRNLKAEHEVSQKQIFESRFLITDSLNTFKWKILPETRTIAGFECHKAITTICDSVVVVAFYTDEIIPTTGPESFNGLPGMILEIAIPRLYTTWVATKLEALSPKEEAKIAAPTKGKAASAHEMTTIMRDALKGRDEKYYHRDIWFATL